MNERRWIIVASLLALMAILVFAPGARSHSWYDQECCSGLDCAPVLKVEYAQPMEVGGFPRIVVTTKIGTAIVPPNFTPRESKDGQMHACMKLSDPNPATRFLCLYLPPAM